MPPSGAPSSTRPVPKEYRSWWPRSGKARAGAILSAFLVGAALCAPLVAPHDPLAQRMDRRLEVPSRMFPFGTDHLGRCLLSRVLWGARKTLLIAGVAGLTSLALGTLLGIAAGYLGGWFDQAVTAATDFLLAFPFLLLAVVLAGALGQTTLSLLLALCAVGWTQSLRVVRSLVLVEREKPFIHAARALGTSRTRIVCRHLLPQVLPQAIVLGALGVGELILVVTGLGFLGLGPPPPDPEWGAMVHDGRLFLRVAPRLVLIPALATALAVLGCNLLGEGLQEQSKPGRLSLPSRRP